MGYVKTFGGKNCDNYDKQALGASRRLPEGKGLMSVVGSYLGV